MMNILFCFLNTALRRFFPIGLTVLVNELESIGHRVKIFDTSFFSQVGEDLDLKRRESGFYKSIDDEVPIRMNSENMWTTLIDDIEQFKPELVAISALSIHFDLSKELAKKVKDISPHIPIILGGIHATVSPDACIREDCFDMICLGEGEETLKELTRCIETDSDYSSVGNLWYKHNGRITRNSIQPLKKLDELPNPDWNRFDPQHIWGALYGKMYRMAPVELSRGCPYKCTYCVNECLRNLYAQSGKYHRRKSLEKAINDMLYLKQTYNIDMFYILDETFLSMTFKQLVLLAKMYKKTINTPFFIQTRPETVSEEKAQLLAEMGCVVVSMGIENGNEHLRRQILNRKVSDKQIIEAFRILRKIGIKTSSFNMLGIPGETEDTILETIELNRLCDPDSVSVSYFFPYQGTSLRDYALEKRMIIGDENPGLANYQPVLKLPTVSKEVIINYYEKFVELRAQ